MDDIIESNVIEIPIVNLIRVNEDDSIPIKKSNKQFTEIPTKDIDIFGKEKDAPSYNFLQDVIAFVDRSDYKEYQLNLCINDIKSFRIYALKILFLKQ